MAKLKIRVDPEAINSFFFPYLVDYTTRTEVYYGGAGSGKSHFIAQKLLVKALSAKREVLVIRKVGRTLKDSVFKLLLDLLTDYGLKPYIEVNKSNYTITLPNGSRFLFKGLDDNEKLKSIVGITDIWIEEATEINFDDYTQLSLRLRAPVENLQIFLSFNPVSKVNWVYKTFFENEPPPNTKIIKSTYKHNKFLPPDYIQSLEEMARGNPTYYRIYALGEFASLSKLIYTNWRVSDEDFDKSSLTLIAGLDFGYTNDPSAFVVAYLDSQNKKIFVVREFVKRGMLNDEIARVIESLGYAKEVIIADSAEQKSIEEIKRLGIPRIRPATKGPGSLLQGIQKLQQYEIVLSSSCENLKTELENYAWKKDKSSGEYTNVPEDTFNHSLDALRYALQAERNRLKTFNMKM